VAGYLIRTPSDDEAEAVAALVNAHALAAHGESTLTAQTVREWLEDPAVDMRIAVSEGELVCYGDLMLTPSGDRANLDIREHPSHQGSANGMLDAFEAAAAERGATAARAFAYTREVSYVEQLTARGYVPIRSSYEMLIRAEAAVAPVAPPAGLEIRPRLDGQERQMYAAEQESFADHWGFEPRPFEEWRRFHLDRAFDDSSLQFLAWDGDEIAGVCLCAPHQSLEPGYGWVDSLGVRPPWRRRGLALALLLHAFAEFRARGFDRVGLGVDAESTTGALELYEKAGMSVVKQLDTFERTLSSKMA
jgi:mycothiol synthase